MQDTPEAYQSCDVAQVGGVMHTSHLSVDADDDDDDDDDADHHHDDEGR